MLRQVDISTSGKFQCEVSGEAPLFLTATNSNVLIVVGKLSSRKYTFLTILITDLPDSGPIISGSHSRYSSGDILSAKCTSFNSFPAANLTWYVNGEEATDKMIVKHSPTVSRKGLLTSVLGLRIKIHDKLFNKSGDLKIKCTSAVHSIYWRSNEESITEMQSLIVLDHSKSDWKSAFPILSSSSSISSEFKSSKILNAVISIFYSAS